MEHHDEKAVQHDPPIYANVVHTQGARPLPVDDEAYSLARIKQRMSAGSRKQTKPPARRPTKPTQKTREPVLT